MRHIKKSSEPRELAHWFRSTPQLGQRRINCGYDEMPGTVRDKIKRSCLNEQGWLCCYTGRDVDETTSHIEHYKPQSQCINYEDVTYSNLLAAYPGVNARRCRYGAHKKDDWFDVELLINPTKATCQKRFAFTVMGEIKPARHNDYAAVETIRRLGLQDDELIELRKVAIHTALFRKPLSVAKLEKVVQNGFCIRGSNHKFPKFCFVIESVADTLLKRENRSQRARQAAHTQQRQKRR